MANLERMIGVSQKELSQLEEEEVLSINDLQFIDNDGLLTTLPDACTTERKRITKPAGSIVANQKISDNISKTLMTSNENPQSSDTLNVSETLTWHQQVRAQDTLRGAPRFYVDSLDAFDGKALN